MDLEKLTVQELKGRLTELDVSLSQDKQFRKAELIALLGEVLSRKPTSAKPPAESRQCPENIAYRPSMKHNKNTDIFSQRIQKEFSPEIIEKIESKASYSLKNFLSSILLLFLIGTLIGFGFLAVKNHTRTIPFCSEGVKGDCLACPMNGQCQQGDLICRRPYIRERNECVEDKSIVQEALQLLEKCENYIIQESIELYLESRSPFYFPVEQIEDISKSKVEVLNKLHSLLNANTSNKIEILMINGKTSLRAKEPFLSITHQITAFWQDNKYILIGSLLAMVFLVKKCLDYKQKRQIMHQMRKLYEMIREQLSTNADGSFDHGMPEESILNMVETNFGKKLSKRIWPFIEELRKNDSNVCKFETLIEGRPYILWQWKSNTPVQVGNKMKYL